MEARYNTRIQGCASEGELVDYLLRCVPLIKEYTLDAEDRGPVVQQVASLKVAGRKGVRRNDIYKKYLNEVECEYESFEVPVSSHEEPCPKCGALYTRFVESTSSDEICQKCGHAEAFLGDEVGFKEEQTMEKNVVYFYKRENHFNEWISQFQAKESTTVPEDIISKLRSEFKKQKIKNLSDITHEKVKGLLKKLNCAKYYEHVAYISAILNGITPPTMPQTLEDRLRLMFHSIQGPFEKHKPESRKNFLSYSYVLYKFCELLGEDDYLPCFPLLKSKEKLAVQDQIWFKICKELNWEYIRTF